VNLSGLVAVQKDTWLKFDLSPLFCQPSASLHTSGEFISVKLRGPFSVGDERKKQHWHGVK
jgi:hypothetical protein